MGRFGGRGRGDKAGRGTGARVLCKWVPTAGESRKHNLYDASLGNERASGTKNMTSSPLKPLAAIVRKGVVATGQGRSSTWMWVVVTRCHRTAVTSLRATSGSEEAEENCINQGEVKKGKAGIQLLGEQGENYRIGSLSGEEDSQVQ